MGDVFRAQDTTTLEHVAIKLLREEHARDAQARKRFLREARSASAVSHPNVVRILDVSDADGEETPFIVMELLVGETLGARLGRKGKLAPRETAAIMLPVFDAVLAAHAAGIVHRDLKPENVFLAREGNGVRVCVLDFGIAKIMDRLEASSSDHAATTAAATTTGAMLGTPYYMAPEQALGEKNIDGRADLWSIGVLMYECLSAKRPTEADTLGGILKIIVTDAIKPLGEELPDLDPELADEIMDLLRSNRDKRATSLDALRTTLMELGPEDLDVPDAPAVSIAIAEPGQAVAVTASERRRSYARPALALGGVALLLFMGSRVLGARTPAPAASGSLEESVPVAARSSAPTLLSATTTGPSAIAPTPAPVTLDAGAEVRTNVAPQVAAAASTARHVTALPSSAPSSAGSSGLVRGPSGLVTDNPFVR
jgi:serine/threonine-protein kinase